MGGIGENIIQRWLGAYLIIEVNMHLRGLIWASNSPMWIENFLGYVRGHYSVNMRCQWQGKSTSTSSLSTILALKAVIMYSVTKAKHHPARKLASGITCHHMFSPKFTFTVCMCHIQLTLHLVLFLLPCIPYGGPLIIPIRVFDDIPARNVMTWYRTLVQQQLSCGKRYNTASPWWNNHLGRGTLFSGDTTEKWEGRLDFVIHWVKRSSSCWLYCYFIFCSTIVICFQKILHIMSCN